MISQFVLDEAAAGDPGAAAKRIASLEGIARLDTKRPEIEALALALLTSLALPQKALVDALHIAVSSVAAVDILLTWNFKHIANGAMMEQIERVCSDNGFECPRLLTPLQLLGDDDVD